MQGTSQGIEISGYEEMKSGDELLTPKCYICHLKSWDFIRNTGIEYK